MVWSVAMVMSIFFSAAASAAGELPRFPKNSRYDDARQSLLALGWEPVRQSAKNCDGMGCYDRCAPGFEQRCKAYPEAVICRGTGVASCEFLWKRRDTVIEVRSVGEDDPPIVAGVRCLVNCR